MKKTLVVLFAIFLSGCAAVSLPLQVSSSLVDNGELFCLPNGVNEFDLVEAGGDYFLFSHDYDMPETMVRRASDLPGLAKAKPLSVLPGRYPTVIVEEGQWHAWLYDAQNGTTTHYLASRWDGPYVKQQEVGIYGAADWHVRRNPQDEMYYATYKSILSNFAGLARAADPEGPWVDLGWIFDDQPRAGWHAFEEADPAIFFYSGHAYVSFAGWNSPRFGPAAGLQRLGMVELDMKRFRVKEAAVMLLEPKDEWQRRGGSTKIFNPIVSETPQGLRMLYSHNPSSKGVCSGIGVADLRNR